MYFVPKHLLGSLFSHGNIIFLQSTSLLVKRILENIYVHVIHINTFEGKKKPVVSTRVPDTTSERRCTDVTTTSKH